MKTLVAILFAAVLVHGMPARAGSPANSTLIGSWAVDISRLPTPPEARPKSATITFGDAGDRGWATRVDIVDASGSRKHIEGFSPLDGTPRPVTGNYEADVAATTMPVSNVLIMQLAKDGLPASTRIYTVVEGGKSMIETAAYFGKDGQPIMRTHYFTRVR